MAEDDTSCIVQLVGQLLALVGKVPHQFIRQNSLDPEPNRMLQKVNSRQTHL